jgi:hypothetical protein
MPPTLRRALCILCLVLAAPALAGTPATASADSGRSPDGVPQRLVLALDGIPYEVFAALQARGELQRFRPAARMISTFPSLSDVAFAQIEGGAPPAGYQVTRYDPETNRIVGMDAGSLSERAHPKIAADSASHSVAHRVLGYVVPAALARRDLRRVGAQLLRSDKRTFVAYIGTSDAVLHLKGRAGAEKYLRYVDAEIGRLQAKVRARTGRDLLVDLVSDHGSTMIESRVVPVEERLAACGFRRGEGLGGADDVAFSLPGLVAQAAIFTSPDRAESAARCLAGSEGVDLVAFARGDAVGVLTADGEAEVRRVPGDTERYAYKALRGDPFALLGADAAPGTEREFDARDSFTATITAPRPDPLRRVWRAFHGDVAHPATVLLSLADGWEVGNPKLRFLTKLRGGHHGTHGSMTRNASTGVIASTWRDVADVNTAGANVLLYGDSVDADMARALGDGAASVTAR